MSETALVLTYHAIEAGPAPLCFEPELFKAHLEVIEDSRSRVLSLGELAEQVRRGGPDRPSIALTFDDGFASVAETAAPMLADRGMPGTIFCVAGHLGGRNDFPADPPGTPRLPLASGEALAELGAGLEVGSHGMEHAPLELIEGDPAALRREILDSKELIEQRTGRRAAWFAEPYGSGPGPAGRILIESTYEGACGTGMRPVPLRSDVHRWPRIDAHYLRRPAILRRVLEGGEAYLSVRRLGAQVRRIVRRDFIPPPA